MERGISLPKRRTREGAIRMVVQQQARRGVTQDSYDDLLDAWREQVEQARRGQEAGWSLPRESAEAYEDFLDSLFFYYGENARAAEKGTREG
jgi:hypothetical protein